MNPIFIFINVRVNTLFDSESVFTKNHVGDLMFILVVFLIYSMNRKRWNFKWKIYIFKFLERGRIVNSLTALLYISHWRSPTSTSFPHAWEIWKYIFFIWSFISCGSHCIYFYALKDSFFQIVKIVSDEIDLNAQLRLSCMITIVSELSYSTL